MNRKWKDMQNDEIYALWKEYLRTEGLAYSDPIRYDPIKSKPMRLTAMEVIRLVEELLDRLEAKEAHDEQKEMDSGCNQETRCSSQGIACARREEDPSKEASCCCKERR